MLEIYKVYEDKNKVIYKYRANGAKDLGEIEFLKENNKVSVIELSGIDKEYNIEFFAGKAFPYIIEMNEQGKFDDYRFFAFY